MRVEETEKRKDGKDADADISEDFLLPHARSMKKIVFDSKAGR